MKAILLCGTYRRKSQPAAATQCHICQEMRSNMSGHLLTKHKISKKSPELKGFGTKVDATKIIAEGKYSNVDEVLALFRDQHFDNLGGGRQSLKDCTARNSKKQKMTAVTKILYWLVDNSSKVRDIQSAMERIQDLGKAEVGYFDQHRTNCNDKGRNIYDELVCITFICKSIVSFYISSKCVLRAKCLIA